MLAVLDRITRYVILQCKLLIYKLYWLFYAPLLYYVIKLITEGFANNEKYVSIIGVISALIFFIQKHKLDEANYFKEVFTKFNSRYDRLNNSLMQINENSSLSINEKAKLIDYFNLCAEEYLIYEKGYIPLKVWKSWMSGVEQYWKIQKIRMIWEQELNSNSYYGFCPSDEIFITKNGLFWFIWYKIRNL